MPKSDIPDYAAGKRQVAKEGAERLKYYKEITKALEDAIKRCDEIDAHLQASWPLMESRLKEQEACQVRIAAFASSILAIRDKAVADYAKKPDPKIPTKAFKSIQTVERQLVTEANHFNKVTGEHESLTVDYELLVAETLRLP